MQGEHVVAWKDGMDERQISLASRWEILFEDQRRAWVSGIDYYHGHSGLPGYEANLIAAMRDPNQTVDEQLADALVLAAVRRQRGIIDDLYDTWLGLGPDVGPHGRLVTHAALSGYMPIPGKGGWVEHQEKCPKNTAEYEDSTARTWTEFYNETDAESENPVETSP